MRILAPNLPQERYESLKEDPEGVPPFHYGSHYSSAGTLSSPSCRCGLEPYVYVSTR